MDVLGEEISRTVLECAKESGLVGDVSIDVSSLTNKGDNYLGVLFGIQATGQDASGNPKTLPLVLKRMHKERSVNESLQGALTFANEINFYYNIAPAFRDFQEKYGKTGKNLLDFIPRCYKSKRDGVSDFILLEDLRNSGFNMSDRKVGLSREECMLVMRSIGRFHAFSYAMKEKHPETFKRLSDRLKKNPFFAPEKRDKYYELFQKAAVNAVEGVCQQSPEAAKTLEPLITGGYFDVITRFNSMKDNFSVILHGDTWTNNILFRGNPPSDLRFVDYQVMMYLSPSADVMYTLNTSVSQELKDVYFEDFLQEYHSALTNTLRQLRVNPDALPMNVFKDQIRKYALYSIGYAMFVTPLVWGGEYEEEKHFDEEDAMVKMVLKHSCCMKDKKIQTILVELVKDYSKRGYLNN